MEPVHVFRSFVSATFALVIWRRLLHLIFVHCAAKVPLIPAWLQGPDTSMVARSLCLLKPYTVVQLLLASVAMLNPFQEYKALHHISHTNLDVYLYQLLTQHIHDIKVYS
ncbi:hypothetical protein PVAP13_7NG370200 [Panicum virgatum]|uniref:Uncharacterized protein n=1 Tax=Panicum virgatum TaxID=38727 RepID=A0A8T0Q2K6_PANVG|nr:hypothetical protein PVAP13_7NG370200 [Panicum virgatum]